jgi:LPXTG-site transpeptidase (sortase) family protein
MISKILLLIGIGCLALYGFFTVQAHFRQRALEQELYQPLKSTVPRAGPARGRNLKEGDLFGRLEIPRLNLSVMVMEGYKDKTLRLGAGHIPGTPLAIAGHRDSFFRSLKDIKMYDTIRLTTPEETTEYRVVSTKIVGPKDVSVLDIQSDDTLILITCYPFRYIGPAPKRFIVEAAKN